MNTAFFYGVGVGMAAGAVASHMMQPEQKKHHSKNAGKTLKAVGTVVESVADVMGK